MCENWQPIDTVPLNEEVLITWQWTDDTWSYAIDTLDTNINWSKTEGLATHWKRLTPPDVP